MSFTRQMTTKNLQEIKRTNLMTNMQDYFTKKQPKFIKRQELMDIGVDGLLTMPSISVRIL